MWIAISHHVNKKKKKKEKTLTVHWKQLQLWFLMFKWAHLNPWCLFSLGNF